MLRYYGEKHNSCFDYSTFKLLTCKCMVKLTKRNQQQNNALPELMCLHYKENEMNVVYSFNFVFTSQMEE